MCRAPDMKLFIPKGEMRRHLMNCSTSDAYDENIQSLSRALSVRGYRLKQNWAAPYDARLRQDALIALAKRDRFVAKPDSARNVPCRDNIFVFKTFYHSQLHKLGIQRHCYNLLPILGKDTIRDARVVVAHPLSSNLFLKYHPYNFAPNSSPSRQV